MVVVNIYEYESVCDRAVCVECVKHMNTVLCVHVTRFTKHGAANHALPCDSITSDALALSTHGHSR